MSAEMFDMDETARLVFMDQPRSVKEFADAMRELHPGAGLVEIAELWSKYRGGDRRYPTHDYLTGQPIRLARQARRT